MLQYTAVSIQNSVWNCHARSDYQKNLVYVAAAIRKAIARSELDLPVRLITLSEGGLGGWAGAGGQNHLKAYRELAPTIPGEETDFLGELCKEYGFYLAGQMQIKDDSIIKDRVFNAGFIIDPNGKVILKHIKTLVFQREPMVTPMDIWKVYVDKYGNDPVKLCEAVYPVAKTDIGNIGLSICAEGSFPEMTRGLAVNGAEIIVRGQYVEPWIGNGMFEIQNKAHAIFNTCYVIAPSIANHYGSHLDARGYMPPEQPGTYGKSQIIDYRGSVLSELQTGDSYVSAILNIDGLRDFRVRGLWMNLVKDLRVEMFKVIYDALEAKGGLYPKNIWIDEPPTADQAWSARYTVNRAVELGIYTPPPGWKPYELGKEVEERLERAKKHS